MNLYKKFTTWFCVCVLSVAACSQTAGAQNIDDAQYWPVGPEIVSASGIVMEAGTGAILYEKNSRDVHYPASITKILTTLLAIENSQMDEIVTFSYDAVHKTEGSGIARDVDEQMTMEQCLFGVMLASSNECSYAVAEHVAGDIDRFIQMMNERAAALGCQNTNFTNCNGLPDDNHYTSAYDMALIAQEAFQNETFRYICATKTYTIPFTNKHTDEETYLQNHHQMLYPYRTRKYLYDDCLGGKTGYTTLANNTLVTYAERDGMTLICVTLNSPASGHYEDTRALFDFCFDNFKAMNVSENETSYNQKSPAGEGVMGNYEPFVALDTSDYIILPIAAEFTDASSEMVDGKQGEEEVLGSIRYTYANRFVGGADIVATNAVVETFHFYREEDEETLLNQEVASKSETNQSVANQRETLPVEEKVIQIDVKIILGVLFGAIAFVVLIFLILKFAENFYYIKRKLNIGNREKSPYKTIKKNKMYRKKSRRRF